MAASYVCDVSEIQDLARSEQAYVDQLDVETPVLVQVDAWFR